MTLSTKVTTNGRFNWAFPLPPILCSGTNFLHGLCWQTSPPQQVFHCPMASSLDLLIPHPSPWERSQGTHTLQCRWVSCVLSSVLLPSLQSHLLYCSFCPLASATESPEFEMVPLPASAPAVLPTWKVAPTHLVVISLTLTQLSHLFLDLSDIFQLAQNLPGLPQSLYVPHIRRPTYLALLPLFTCYLLSQDGNK